MLSRAKILYNYEPQEEDEIELKEGQIVTYSREESDGWAEITTKNGKKGFIPIAYLEIVQENFLGDDNVDTCTAIYDYLDGGENDITFKKGKKITILERNDDGWFVGQLEDGSKGYFPSNYTDVWQEVKGELNDENSELLETEESKKDTEHTSEEKSNQSPDSSPTQEDEGPSPPSGQSHELNTPETPDPKRRPSKDGTGDSLPTPPQKTIKKNRMRRKISLIDSPTKQQKDNKRENFLVELQKKNFKKKQKNNGDSNSGSRTPTTDPPANPSKYVRRRTKSTIPKTSDIKKKVTDHQIKKKKKTRKSSRKEKRRKTSEQLRKLNPILGSGDLVDVLEIPPKEIKKCRDENGEIVVLGEGSFGKVFKCMWQRGSFDEPIYVAVKVVALKLAKETLEKEVLTVKLLNHPSVVNVFGFSYLSSRKFGIVMEYIDGGTMFDLAQNNFKKFDTEKKICMYDKWMACRRMTEAVRFLHSRRVLHRDIKSLNFLVTKNRKTVKICDFGLAKIKTESKTVDLQTGLKGTVRYMAPELSEDPPKYSIKSDIFSLGMCFFEVCTGRIPFEDQRNEIQVLMLIMKGTVPKIPENIFVPDELKCLIELCLKSDPDERPATEDILKFMKDREAIFLKNYPPPKRLKKSKNKKNKGGEKNNSIFMKSLESCFRCPISKKVMEDPYLLVESGISYEKDSIEDYLEKNDLDPLNGEELESKLVVENITLRKAIEIWKNSK